MLSLGSLFLLEAPQGRPLIEVLCWPGGWDVWSACSRSPHLSDVVCLGLCDVGGTSAALPCSRIFSVVCWPWIIVNCSSCDGRRREVGRDESYQCYPWHWHGVLLGFSTYFVWWCPVRFSMCSARVEVGKHFVRGTQLSSEWQES